jgi:hypothetical protein
MKFYTFSLRITTADVIRALTEAIAFFGWGFGYFPTNDSSREHIDLIFI